MYRIRRFGIMRTATVVAVMYMLIIAVLVVPVLLLALVFAPSQGTGTAGGIGGILVIGFFVIFVYGFLGWVFTAIAVAVYNVAARWVGGIEVQIETVEAPPQLPAWGTPPQAPPPSTLPAPPTDSGPPAPTV
jgi:hypothetical protein